MVTWPTVPRITCKKNRIDYDCRAYPSAVGHVINFAQDEFENDVLPILDADSHMTNCTKNNLQKESYWLTADRRASQKVRFLPNIFWGVISITGAVDLGGQGGHLPTQFLENKIEIL